VIRKNAVPPGDSKPPPAGLSTATAFACWSTAFDYEKSEHHQSIKSQIKNHEDKQE
jgi:hypothetical protein